MATSSKQLTAKVNLDVRSAESAIGSLIKKINSLHTAVKNAMRVDDTTNRTIAQYDKMMVDLTKKRETLASKERETAMKVAAQKERLELDLAAKKEMLEAKLSASERMREAQTNAYITAQEQRLAFQKQKYAEQQAQRQQREQEKQQRAIQRQNELLRKQQEREARVRAEAERVNNEYRKAHPLLTRIADRLGVSKDCTKQWGEKQTKLLSKFKSTNSVVNSIWQKLKSIVGMYAGLQTVKLGIETADKITGAENRFNNLEGGSEELTAKSMEKIYGAAQRSRSAYTDMLSNVSKTMTLAGDSFQGNIDNAIRFQEIMAKAYVVGGASATEMETSMYQLVQALGAGTLAGDELRSVREGAPLAYKEIEKFAQKVLKSELSLKDLAAEGVVTSDIVVAAIMNMEDGIDKSFENTEMTFAQAWTNIKNTASRAFQPVLQQMTDLLNSDEGAKVIDAISTALVLLAKAVGVLFTAMFNFVNWCAENWSWLKWVIIGALMLMITWTIIKAGISIFCAYQEMKAWMLANGVTWATIGSLLVVLGVIAVIVIAVLALVAVFILWKTGTIDTCQAIIAALLIVGIAVAIIGLLMGSWITVIVGLVIAAIGLIVKYLDYFLGIVYSIGAFIYNLVVGVLDSVLQQIYNTAQPILSIVEWILNACNGGFNSFGDAVANLIGQIIGWFLSLGKVVTKIIDAIFGTDWTSGLESLRENVTAWGKNEKAITLTGDAPTISSIANSMGLNLPDRISYADAWNKGMEHGAIAQDWIANLGSKFQGDGLMSKLEGLSDQLPNVDDPALALGDAYDPSGINDDIADGLKKLGDIDDNTSDIAGSMDLTQEDVEYLRKIANMEWKKEFTTANITVDMSNYNTINGEQDLDGIVERLTDKLYEELASVADGVYA